MSKIGSFPQALHDFSKSNGANTVFNTVGPSLARQEFAEECDINSIMKKYETTGGMNGLAPLTEPRYIDFTEVPDNLIDYLKLMNDAQEQFMMLPAVVRREFDNDPVMFVDFAADPANLEQMRTWGLASPVKAPEAPAMPDIPPPAPAPKEPS